MLLVEVQAGTSKQESRGGVWHMSNGDLNWIANFIWGIADDVLRDLYKRGEYRDVILPMTVLRRLSRISPFRTSLARWPSQ